MHGTVGIQSLPPEVLEGIFTDVVESVVSGHRAWTALKLTHVCKSFRQAALDCPRLWSCLSRNRGRPGLALIEACVERSKEHPLDVTLYFYPSDQVFEASVDSLARVAIPVCSRWRRYSVVFTFYASPLSQQQTVSSLESKSLFESLKVPNLEELVVEKETLIQWVGKYTAMNSDNTLLPQALHFCSWAKPQNIHPLRSLTLMNIPGTIAGLTQGVQMRSLILKYDGISVSFEIVLLRVFQNHEILKRMQLSFHRCSFSGSRTSDSVSTILPSVSSLAVEFINCSQTDEHGLWWAFTMLGFINLVDLTVVITTVDSSLVVQSDCGSHDITLVSFLYMRTPQALPCLETFNVDIRPMNGANDASSTYLLLPYSVLPPSLKHLTLRCPFALSLSHTIARKSEEVILLELFDATARVLPSDFKLQTIIFDLPEVGGVVKWVHGIALQMEMGTQYHWDDFEELTIKDQGKIVQVIGRDDLTRWCEERIDD